MWNQYPLVLAQSDPAPNVNSAPKTNSNPAVNETGTTQKTENPSNGTTNPIDPATQSSPWSFAWPLVLMIVLMYLLLFLPQRKERKRRDEMITSLKKSDKVQTIGGIIGTVVEVREHEVVIKVDEKTNTKMHMTPGAIQAVVNTKD